MLRLIFWHFNPIVETDSPSYIAIGINFLTGNGYLDNEGNIIAYEMRSNEASHWVTNPLVEQGLTWNFEINENGQYIMHNILEESGYEPYPIQGVRFLKPGNLPATFWNESNPVDENDSRI